MSAAWEAITRWLRRASPPARPASGRDPLPSRIGRYAITGKLGEGGMGVVYAARDERLDRAVAVKTMSSLSGDEEARRRFWREARVAASVNHPNVCQLYEIGEDRGALFIVMELMEGEPLSERLRRGPIGVAEGLPIGLGMLAALSALHARGIVHRDLKPSNVFLTPHGVKLLDFGLAKPVSAALDPARVSADLTRTGLVMGTPQYMAPEQVQGRMLDERTDLFAAGAILFEMLSGRPAFMGGDMISVLHATLHDHPPALTGSPAVAAVDRVIRRSLAKRPPERYGSAAAMAGDLRAVDGAFEGDTPARVVALTRLVVLPFRILRPDPETDFLAFSLPDAIATSLSRTGSLLVRSSAAAARFGPEATDLRALASEAGVDRVVMGTLLRSGDQLQVTVQLVEAPGGTLLGSHSILSSLGDLFRLQSDIAQRVVESLALPLAGSPATPAPDSPHDARAYALYLQANEMGRAYDQLPRARDLYQRCLELDPGFAPAWARLGRCHRVIGKYIDDSEDPTSRAEVALRRALELNPRLSLAHKFYANLESDTGQSRGALIRLLGEAGRNGNDPELYSGLVHACRYCGLFEQSFAAHREARRLDPGIATGVEQTALMSCDLQLLLTIESRPGTEGGDEVIRAVGYGLAGRREEARAALLGMREAARIPAFKPWTEFLMAWLDRRPAEMRTLRGALSGLRVMDDPEAIFQEGWFFCDVGEHRDGLALIRRAVSRGYQVAPTLAAAAQFDEVRNDPDFRDLLARCEAGREQALAAFREGGGERLLGRCQDPVTGNGPGP